MYIFYFVALPKCAYNLKMVYLLNIYIGGLSTSMTSHENWIPNNHIESTVFYLVVSSIFDQKNQVINISFSQLFQTNIFYYEHFLYNKTPEILNAKIGKRYEISS